MRAFARLLDQLSFTPSRNAKLVLLRDYLGGAPDPERGWALASLTGALSFDAAKPGFIRKAAEARLDPQLFALSYDFVGDLAETVALVWPAKPGANREPELPEVVESLRTASRREVPQLLERWLDALDATGRWALLKLLTGGLDTDAVPFPFRGIIGRGVTGEIRGFVDRLGQHHRAEPPGCIG